MSKHEAPPFRMVIERGKLVPATAYDAERLDTYRSGMEVRVRFTEERDRVMVRKWWAIIGRAVKECKTPWKTREEASEAIKLSLGIVNLSKTVGGTWMQYPKSLTELDDPELTQAVEQMIDVIYHVTGVDPSEWRKHVAHMKDEESPAAPSSADDKAAGLSSPQSDPAADQSAAADPAEGDEVPPASEPSAVQSRADCIKAFLTTATDKDLSVQERRDLLEKMKEWWKDALASDLDFVRAALTTADKVAKGELGEKAARGYLESLP